MSKPENLMYQSADLGDQTEDGLRVVQVVNKRDEKINGYVVDERGWPGAWNDEAYEGSRAAGRIALHLSDDYFVPYASSQLVDPRTNQVVTFFYSSDSPTEDVLKLAKRVREELQREGKT